VFPPGYVDSLDFQHAQLLAIVRLERAGARVGDADEQHPQHEAAENRHHEHGRVVRPFLTEEAGVRGTRQPQGGKQHQYCRRVTHAYSSLYCCWSNRLFRNAARSSSAWPWILGKGAIAVPGLPSAITFLM